MLQAHSCGIGTRYATALTAIQCYQPALFDIKLFLLVDLPFMEAIATQSLAPVLFPRFRLAKAYNITHILTP